MPAPAVGSSSGPGRAGSRLLGRLLKRPGPGRPGRPGPKLGRIAHGWTGFWRAFAKPAAHPSASRRPLKSQAGARGTHGPVPGLKRPGGLRPSGSRGSRLICLDENNKFRCAGGLKGGGAVEWWPVMARPLIAGMRPRQRQLARLTARGHEELAVIIGRPPFLPSLRAK